MRVVQMGPYPPPHGGVQTNLVAIRDYIRKHGGYCGVINLTRFRKPETDDVYSPKSPLEVARLLFRLRCDIVHIHIGGDLHPEQLGLCLFCSLLPRVKTVLTFHSGGYPTSPEGQAAAPRTLRGFVFRRLDRIIAVNPQIEKLFHRFGVSPRRVRLIYPHSVARPADSDTLPEEIERFLRLHRPVLLTVGLLEPEYDLKLQIEMLGHLRRSHPEAGLIIAGDGSLKEELSRRIRDCGYGEHVLLYGDVPHGAALRIIADCDLFLRTTLYDGDSISVREALHLGTPVIATDNGMRPEGVRLIPKSNIEALLEAIREQLSQPRGIRSPLGEENLEAVWKLYQELV